MSKILIDKSAEVYEIGKKVGKHKTVDGSAVIKGLTEKEPFVSSATMFVQYAEKSARVMYASESNFKNPQECEYMQITYWGNGKCIVWSNTPIKKATTMEVHIAKKVLDMAANILAEADDTFVSNMLIDTFYGAFARWQKK